MLSNGRSGDNHLWDIGQLECAEFCGLGARIALTVTKKGAFPMDIPLWKTHLSYDQSRMIRSIWGLL